MTNARLQSRIAELESEVGRLKVLLARAEGKKPHIKDWFKNLQTCFTPEDVAAHKEMMRFVRQYRDSDRDLPSAPALTKLRRDYNTILTKLKTLAHFKTKTAAAEYAHREFTR